MRYVVTVLTVAVFVLPALAASTAYDFGNPGPDAEYMRWCINRARMDPEAEADRGGLVNTHPDDVPNGTYDIGEGLPTLSGVPNQRVYWARYQGARQPLAWSAALVAAAANHADDMHTYSYFSHSTIQSRHGYSNGDAPWDRAYDEGYINHYVGENIAVNNSGLAGLPDKSAEDVHWALFLEPTYTGRGHRRNMLHSRWREVGVGYVRGPVNAQNYTDYWVVDFASDAFYTGSPDPWPPVDTAFITGVVFNDLNADSEYDPGEQKAGLYVMARLASSGAELKYHAVTAGGGGYTIPLLKANGSDVLENEQVKVTIFDEPAKKVFRAKRTVTAGNVIDEDSTTNPSPPDYLRLNIGINATTGQFHDVLAGDANLDAWCDLSDLSILASNYRKTFGMGWMDGDFSGDGKVDLSDLSLLAGSYRLSEGAAPSAPVPEPATLVLLALAGGGTILRRRTRRGCPTDEDGPGRRIVQFSKAG